MKPMSTRDFIKYLESKGCTFIRRCGTSHAIYGNAIKQTTVPINHRTMAPGTMRDICKQLEIEKPNKHRRIA